SPPVALAPSRSTRRSIAQNKGNGQADYYQYTQDYERQIHGQRLSQSQRRFAQWERVLHRQAGRRIASPTNAKAKALSSPRLSTYQGDGAFLCSAKIFTAGVLLRFPRQLILHLPAPAWFAYPLPCGDFFAHLPFSK